MSLFLDIPLLLDNGVSEDIVLAVVIGAVVLVLDTSSSSLSICITSVPVGISVFTVNDSLTVCFINDSTAIAVCVSNSVSAEIGFARDRKTVVLEYDGLHEISVCVYQSFVVATILFVKWYTISPFDQF
uniref:Uncharacterized protein n=1 Tax=Romanomermis culicivorax TaxID=13658 RepID=A0A915JR54_ROMCU